MPRKISARNVQRIVDEREGIMQLLDAANEETDAAGGLRIPIRGPADVAAVRRSVDTTLKAVVGTTLAEAGVAITLCDAIAPLLLRSPDPRAKAIGAAVSAACRIRRSIRRRT